MFPDLSALTEGILPDELRKLVGSITPTTNTLRFKVLVFQKRETEPDRNFVRIRAKSNLSSLLRLMDAWEVRYPVRVSAEAMCSHVFSNFMDSLANEISEQFRQELDDQGFDGWDQSAAVKVDWMLEMDSIERSLRERKPSEDVNTWWNDTEEQRAVMLGYDISEDAWNHVEHTMDDVDYQEENFVLRYEDVDLFEQIDDEMLRTRANIMWSRARQNARQIKQPVPMSGQWDVRTVAWSKQKAFWYKIFYLEKEFATMHPDRRMRTMRDRQPGS